LAADDGSLAGWHLAGLAYLAVVLLPEPSFGMRSGSASLALRRLKPAAQRVERSVERGCPGSESRRGRGHRLGRALTHIRFCVALGPTAPANRRDGFSALSQKQDQPTADREAGPRGQEQQAEI